MKLTDGETIIDVAILADVDPRAVLAKWHAENRTPGEPDALDLVCRATGVPRADVEGAWKLSQRDVRRGAVRSEPHPDDETAEEREERLNRLCARRPGLVLGALATPINATDDNL
jgi:hypothetical protein